MRKYFLKTFGCAMNYSDSEKIAMIMKNCDFEATQNYENADLIIFNTCSIRQKGEDRVFGLIDDIVKFHSHNGKNSPLIAITGCMVRKTGIAEKYLENENLKRNPAKKIELLKGENGFFNHDDKLFPRLKNLDFTFRIEEIGYLPKILSYILGERIGNDESILNYLKIGQLRENQAQASVVIQTGCDNYCTYCIVPYSRGKEFSRNSEEIIKDCEKAVKSGAKEITLLGQNVNSYGKQFIDKKLWNEEKSNWNLGGGKSPFRKLLEQVNEIEGVDRIRFTSSNPHDMTQDILDAHFELDKMCNYLHIALQSGNDEILKKMNRKHNYSEFKKIVDFLRGKDEFFAISTDIIVGFPGETDEMFSDTVKAFEECEFDFVYIARYSERPGTISAKLYKNDISEEIKLKRWNILNDELLKSLTKRNKMMIGKNSEVLVSGKKDGFFYGRTRNYKEVFFKGNEKIQIGDLVKIKVTDLDKWVLKGELI